MQEAEFSVTIHINQSLFPKSKSLFWSKLGQREKLMKSNWEKIISLTCTDAKGNIKWEEY